MAVETRVLDDDCVPISGWARTSPTLARVRRPRGSAEVAAALRAGDPRGALARGLGRAYGDAAQNAGGTVLDMTGLTRILAFDAAAGLVVCEAGVSLHRLMTALLPRGFFLPVTPATRYVTAGGAVATDVHGANHPGAGSFARHVVALDLLTPDGEVRTAVPGTPLFDATTGGLGLTGIVLTVTLRLLRVETSLLSVDTERVRDLDELMARLAGPPPRRDADGAPPPYEIARIDPLARGAAMGRSVLVRARHAPYEALPRRHRARRAPLVFRPVRLPAPPPYVPGGPLGRTVLGLAGEFRHRAGPRRSTGRLRPLSAVLHPFDALPHGNRLYGPEGFVPYRCAVPYGQEEALCRIVRRIAARRFPALPAVLTRFGEAGPGWLSYPLPGWSLGLDLPTGLPGLAAFLDALDEEVLGAGGRVQLAADSRVRPDAVAAMFPRLADFRALRAALDPGAVLRSDLSRRLAL